MSLQKDPLGDEPITISISIAARLSPALQRLSVKIKGENALFFEAVYSPQG